MNTKRAFFPFDTSNGRVILVQNCKSGKRYSIQYHGLACYHYDNKGKIVGDFHSKHKFFRPSFWYRRIGWLDNLGWLSFLTRQQKKEFHKILGFPKFDYSRNQEKQALLLLMKNAISDDEVLATILKIASKQLKCNLTLEVANSRCNLTLEVANSRLHFVKTSRFGKDWFEALIPVKRNNESGYILTWENCD